MSDIQSPEEFKIVLRELIISFVDRPVFFSELYHALLSEIASTRHGAFDVLMNDSGPYYLEAIRNAIADGDIVSVEYYLPAKGSQIKQEIFFPKGTKVTVGCK